MRWLTAALLLAALVYLPGLSGSWFFDDYPNIVHNDAVQPRAFGIAELTAAALSSPASDLKRPLASLTFAANHAAGGLDPFGWKLVNLAIHLANGVLVWLLCLALLRAHDRRFRASSRPDLIALLIAAAWLVLPINLTAVLFVVQRMESLANLFVLLGLLGYTRARLRLQYGDGRGMASGVASLVFGTAVGLLAKETAVLLPLYALLVEALLFRFRDAAGKHDRRVTALFVMVLLVPALLGSALLTPWLARESTWAARDFDLVTRLLSEARIVPTYIAWTLLPLPQSLSFYHDHFEISRSLLHPWTTALGVASIFAMIALAWLMRRRRPLVSLGIGLFFACHALTATVIPLELIYEHRNYFASFGLLLALVPLLAEPATRPMRPGHLLLGALIAWWAGTTAFTAHAWGNPLRLAADLSVRAPDSPRAQFAYGLALLQASDYSPDAPLVREAESVLERASAMPGASILPEQTLILTRSLMGRPVEPRWWDRLVAKLQDRAPNSEDIDALGALTRCVRDRRCAFPDGRMDDAFAAAAAHGQPQSKLSSIHSDWAWNVLGDRELGARLAKQAVEAKPADADARIALARIAIVLGQPEVAREQITALERLNLGGRLDRDIAELQRLAGSGTLRRDR